MSRQSRECNVQTLTEFHGLIYEGLWVIMRVTHLLMSSKYYNTHYKHKLIRGHSLYGAWSYQGQQTNHVVKVNHVRQNVGRIEESRQRIFLSESINSRENNCSVKKSIICFHNSYHFTTQDLYAFTGTSIITDGFLRQIYIRCFVLFVFSSGERTDWVSVHCHQSILISMESL